jgi:hypothetical protein
MTIETLAAEEQNAIRILKTTTETMQGAQRWLDMVQARLRNERKLAGIKKATATRARNRNLKRL